MAITAALVKELREISGAGMMECKKALVETDGDLDAALDNLRKSGQAKAAKKAGRIAAEGVIAQAFSADGQTAAMVEVNCETDFVAKDDGFRAFAQAERVLASQPADVDALNAAPIADGDATTIEQARQALITKIGENMSVRRFERYVAAAGNTLAGYVHGTRIGVLVESSASVDTGRDLAMHVAASRPVCVSEADMPAELIEKEREIYRAQAADSGKPADIVEKMVDGRVRKYLAEVTLVGQPFVKDPDTTVGKLLASQKAAVARFVRMEVGEGIEKRVENFAEEVMAQARV